MTTTSDRIIAEFLDRHREEVQRHQSTAFGWYDGGDSQMYRFGVGKREARDWPALQRECDQCLNICRLDSERPALEALSAFIGRVVRIWDGITEVQRAATNLVELGLEAQEVERLVEDAMASAAERRATG